MPLVCGQEGHTGTLPTDATAPVGGNRGRSTSENQAQVCARGSRVCAHACAPAPVCVTTALDTPRRNGKGTRAGCDVGTKRKPGVHSFKARN